MGDLDQCLPFNGTSDLYGLGIRVGVYLQLASSHITNTLNQEAAHENYAANSIFVFAIIVALLKAVTATPNEIRPIEVWIMLQICISFLVTTLGSFGLRLHFLRPKALSDLSQKVRLVDWKRLWTFPSRPVNYHDGEELGQTEAKLKIAIPGGQDDQAVVQIHDPAQNSEDQNSSSRLRRTFRWILHVFWYILMNSNVGFTMDSVSFIKHPSLSWGGSAWRISNATIVVCTNIWFWFVYVDEPQHDPCSPVVFFFAPFLLSSHPRLKTLFKVGSIFMVLLVGCLFAFVFVFAKMVYEYLLESIWRWIIRLVMKRKTSTSWNGLPDKIKRVIIISLLAGRNYLYPGFIVTALEKEIWTNDEDALPTLPDLLKAYAVLSSEKHDVVIAAEKKSTELPEKLSWRVWLFCLVVQFWSIGAIAWFIAAVELTIIWNNIQGVHTISTTSQLIPLVIGVISSLLALQQIILSWIKHIYKDWNEIDFKITFGPFGEEVQIIKPKKVPASVNEANQTESSAATDKTSRSRNGVQRKSSDHISPASPQA